MSTTTAHKNLYEIAGDKETLTNFCQSLINEIKDGEINNPERLYAIVNELEKQFKKVKEVIRKETNINPKETPESFGWTFSSMEAGVKYIYDKCGHPDWNKLQTELTEKREEQEKIETTLKSLTKPMTIVDEKTGEIVTVNPPIKKSTTTIKVGNQPSN